MFKNENKVLFIASAAYLSSDITRDTNIFSVKQLGLRLVVLLKIMILPRVLYQTIDIWQLLKTIPLFSNSCYDNTEFTAGFVDSTLKYSYVFQRQNFDTISTSTGLALYYCELHSVRTKDQKGSF